MGTEAFTLRSRLKRKAIPGVRIEDQPLPESYWELAPKEALKPWVKGMMPLGPASLVVAEALLPPTTSLADPVAIAWAHANAGRKASDRVTARKSRCRRRTVHKG